MSESKPDTVPGLGFKDKDKALETLKNLEGRDPDYQKLAIKGLIGRAKRTITLTKDKDKLNNINEAMKIFEDWLKDFEFKNLSKENRAYLPLASVEALLPLKEKYGFKDDLSERFLKAYKDKAKGDYKNLRTVSSGEDKPTWDIVRNQEIKKIWKGFEESKPDLWNDDDLPTEDHLKLIVWAYSPDASKIKKNLSSYEEKLGSLKLSSDNEKGSDEEEEATKKSDDKKASKRKSEGSSSSSASDSDEESPKKKSKKD
ncbi:uracil-DNA degrading factor [Rhynchophorus ferrugineus]|uniref:uracil-DNA degrading factor n=1 Tax=Rhynchophorus ferrugineus TaxID=354439 RepID=UPI003FCD516C